mgnify:FL=1
MCTQADFAAFFDEVGYFLVELGGGDVLVAVGGGDEGESGVVEFDHDFCDCAFGEGVCFFLLDGHELALEQLQLRVEVKVHGL